MRLKSVSPLLLAFALAAFLGCASHPGKESFERGQGLQKQHRFEDAISMYEEAIASEPGNPDYLQEFSSAKHALAAKCLASAKTILDKRTSFDNLTAALHEIDKALAVEPDNKEAKDLAVSVKLQMEAMVKRADELYSSATKAAESKSWSTAVEKLNEIASFYPKYLDLASKLEQIKEEGSAYLLKEAERLRAAEDFPGALKSLASAEELRPGNQRIAAMTAQIREENTPKAFLAKAQAYIVKGECDLALETIRKAGELNPGPETLAEIEKLHREAAVLLFDKSRQDLAAKNLFAAYSDYLSALKFDPAAAKQPSVLELKDQLLSAMLERADAYEEANRLGNALTWQEKASKLQPRREILQKVQALKEKLRQRVVKKIALMDFTSPSASQDAGRIMTDNLLSYLTRNSSGDVKILARDVLGTLLKEIELGQAGLYDIESAKKGGKLKGTDIFIFGSVLNYNVEKNVDEGQKMVNAVIGTKTVPNPAYQEWQATHHSPSDSERQSAPAQTVQEEIREIVKYKVATHKKTANVSVSFRVIDVEEGEVVITKTLKKKLEATDTYSEGVEFANIPFKQLKLPSDSELLEQLVESTIAELGYAVLSRFQNLQVVYANSAEQMKTRGDAELVVERYTDAIIVEEIKNSPSQITEKARNEIELALKTISGERATSDLAVAEKAANEKKLRTPVAVKLPELLPGDKAPLSPAAPGNSDKADGGQQATTGTQVAPGEKPAAMTAVPAASPLPAASSAAPGSATTPAATPTAPAPAKPATPAAVPAASEKTVVAPAAPLAQEKTVPPTAAPASPAKTVASASAAPEKPASSAVVPATATMATPSTAPATADAAKPAPENPPAAAAKPTKKKKKHTSS
jgi:tetratricopeptide (TPR) repeat protein